MKNRGLEFPPEITKRVDELLIDHNNTEIARKIIQEFETDRSIQGIRKHAAKRRKKQSKIVNESKDRTEWKQSEDSAVWSYSGERSIKTIEDAISFAEIDLDKWRVIGAEFNAWDVTMKLKGGTYERPVKRTNYQVKLKLEPIMFVESVELDEFLDKVEESLDERKKKITPKKINNKGKSAVVPLADLHIGAFIRNLLKTQNYDVETCVSMLDEVVEEVNAQRYGKVYISIVGDIIESFTGKNHENNFMSIGYGMTGFTLFNTAYDILENFLSRINNLAGIWIVSGNHDRYSASNKEDVRGGVAQGLAKFIDKFFDVPVRYNPLVISEKVGNVNYITTHGHHGIAKKTPEKIILDYGDQSCYNVIIKAHDHTRRKQRKNEYIDRDIVDQIENDSKSFIMLTCPPIYSGNFYSESNGWTSNPGFLQLVEKHGRVKIIDEPLGVY